MPGPPAAVAAVRHAVRGPLRAAAEEGAGVLVACSGGADSLALAAGLLDVLHPALLPTLQAGARASAAQYDLGTRAAALENMYERTVARGRTRSRFSR